MGNLKEKKRAKNPCPEIPNPNFRECAKCGKYTVPIGSFWDACPKCRGI